MERSHIIQAVDAFAAASGLKPTTICQYAVGNRLFYANLHTDRDYQVGTAQRLLAWLASPKRPNGKPIQVGGAS